MTRVSLTKAWVVVFFGLFGCQPKIMTDTLVPEKHLLASSDLHLEPMACWLNLRIISATEESHYQVVYDATSVIHKLVLLSSLGQRLVTIEQNKDRITYKKTMPMRLPYAPDELLFAMQIIYWPESALSNNASKNGWVIVDKGSSRYVYKEDDLLAEIVYQGSRGCKGGVRYNLRDRYEFILEGTLF